MKRVSFIAVAVGLVCVAMYALSLTALGHRVKLKVFGGATVEQRVAELAPTVRGKWANGMDRYPPRTVTLYAVKEAQVLHVFCDGVLTRSIPITAASGTAGPKLREGDRQVPEGVYGIESLNPNSRFHLALRVDYPSAADIAQAELDGRTDLGGDIMIHGGAASVGCIALGDEAIEDLFVLVADVGIENVTVLIAPFDVREPFADHPERWINEHYQGIADALD